MLNLGLDVVTTAAILFIVSAGLLIVFGVLTVITVVIGTIRYLVTRWALDGPTLRIETGLLKRDARQVPVARIQAVDVIKPFLARLVGLAELPE